MSDQGTSGSRARRLLGACDQKGGARAATPPGGAEPRPAHRAWPTRAVLHDWLQPGRARPAARPAPRSSWPSSTSTRCATSTTASGPTPATTCCATAGRAADQPGLAGTPASCAGAAPSSPWSCREVGSVDGPDQIARALLETVGAPYQLGGAAGHRGLPPRPGHRQRRLRRPGRADPRRPPGPGVAPATAAPASTSSTTRPSGVATPPASTRPGCTRPSRTTSSCCTGSPSCAPPPAS